jgi:integrase/recombinase XerD
MSHLNQHLTDYLQLQQSRRIGQASLQSAKHTIGAFVHWLITQDITLTNQLTTDHLHAYQRHLHDTRTHKGLPLKPTSLNKRISGARNFLTYLHNKGLTTRQLTDQLTYVKTPSVLPTSVLTHKQVRTLIAAIDASTPAGIRDRALFELLYSSGIRVGELEKAQLQDIDLDNAVLKVTGKGDKERLVPIGRTAIRHLISYIKGARPFLAMRRTPADPHIFLNHHGNPLTDHRIRGHLHRHAQNAGLDVNVTPHTFRRTCTTELVRADANLYHVKELLGHETLGTLKHYAKLNINDLKKTHSKCHPRERDK